MSEPLESQIDRLANFIMAEVPGEPSQSEGAVDCAIRWMRSRLAASPAPTRDDVLEEAAKVGDQVAKEQYQKPGYKEHGHTYSMIVEGAQETASRIRERISDDWRRLCHQYEQTTLDERVRADSLAAELAKAREALTEISEGRGPFSTDRFEHACNVIENMKAIARAALPETPEPQP